MGNLGQFHWVPTWLLNNNTGLTMAKFSTANLAPFFDLLCEAAARETLPRFRQGTGITNKLDKGFDPVTEADQRAEYVIRELIEMHFPDHGILGEEYGVKEGASPHQWVIDPIDGTRAFISGLPLWGTLIGLYENGRPVAGVMDQPFTRERYYSEQGESWSVIGEISKPEKLETSATPALSQATLMTTDPNLFVVDEDQTFFQLQKQIKLRRYGCDCYAYAMLAAGHVDLVVESGLNAYDIAALIPIIENAGGLVTSWSGGSAAQGGQILAAANINLHGEAVKILSG